MYYFTYAYSCLMSTQVIYRTLTVGDIKRRKWFFVCPVGWTEN